MKKALMILAVCGLVLTGCSQKKDKQESAEGKEALSTVLPVISNAEKNQVITKTLAYPNGADGSQQKQTITYKDQQFLEMVFEQITPANDDVKNAVAEVGLEETQKLLNEAVEKDTALTEAKKLPGFSASVELINDHELKRVTKFDFQTLDVEKASTLEYFKPYNLKELIKWPPAKYIENQLAGGASLVE